MYINKHLLVGANVGFFFSKKNRVPIEELENVVIHYSAGATAMSSVQYLIDENTPVSAHVLIGRDGRIYQMVDFQTQAWHAGKSRLFSKTNLNTNSIGIELENYGIVRFTDGKFSTWFDEEVFKDEVVQRPHPKTGHPTWWNTYTPVQLSVCKELCKLLIKEYKIKRILGHNEISLSGKIDPGPAFPIDEFRKLIFEKP